jgi:hypothetical protein
MDTQPALDRDEAMLARLAEMDLSLAEKLHAAAMAAEDPAETATLARTYQKIARSLRQSIALKHRIKRDVAQASRGGPSPQHKARVEERVATVREAVTRVIFTETEGEAADWLCNLLEERIDLRVRQTAGVDITTLDEMVTEVCEDLNLPKETAERWRELPDPEPPAAPAAPAASGPILEFSG